MQLYESMPLDVLIALNLSYNQMILNKVVTAYSYTTTADIMKQLVERIKRLPKFVDLPDCYF